MTELSNVLSDVMLKNALSVKNTVDALSSNNRLVLPYFHKSFLSTNSAISKGLRKATHSRSRLDPPARVGGITRNRTNVKNDPTSAFRDRGSKLPPRHFSHDDAPMARRAGNTPLKRRNSLAGSRHVHSKTDGVQRGARGSMESAGTRDRRIKTKTATMTRAERRAALFGHKDNPPEGYKGLPSKAPAPPRSTHNRQEERRLSFPSPGSPARPDSKTFDAPRNTGDHRDYLAPGRLRRQERIVPRLSSASTNSRDNRNGAETQVQRHGLNGWKEQSSYSTEERVRRKTNAPLAIPYTTPASEFLYGHSVVTAALKSSRRTFYKLYLYDGDAAEVRGQDKQVRKLALAANLEVTRVGNDWIKLMDKMSGGRPHNVYSTLYYCDSKAGTQLI